MPHLRLMLADMATDHRSIARHLGVAPRTLARYVHQDQAPRAIMLALFWESRWGRSAADCEAANYGTVNAGLAHALQRENAALKRHILRLETMINDAANAPLYHVGSAS